MAKVKIGEVFHFYTKAGVAALRLTDGPLVAGDTVSIEGPSTNFTQVVDSMQIERETVQRAETGQSVGIKVRERAREGDFVYKVTP